MTPSSDKDLNGLDNPSFVGEHGSHCHSSPARAAWGPEEDGGSGHSETKLGYTVTDVPPWYLCILLGIQHFLTAMGGLVAIPLILSKGLCLQHDLLTQSHLICTIFFVSGICTLLQVLFGVRLPIIQGGTFTFLTPTLAMLSLSSWKCPAWTQNATLVNASSPEFIQVWQTRMREDYFFHSLVLSVLERCCCAAAILPERQEVPPLSNLPLPDLPGAAGAVPELAAVPRADSDQRPACGPHRLRPPGPDGHPRGRSVTGALVPAALPRPVGNANGEPGRDLWHAGRGDLLHAGVRGRLLRVCPPVRGPAAAGARHQPRHRRGGRRLPPGWGLGHGQRHHVLQRERGGSGHHQGSRMVILAGACAMLLSGIFGKAGAVLASIPIPVIGGMFLVMFGVITAVGISNLQYTNMNSSRNIFIFGFSLFAGLTIPNWASKNSAVLETGIIQLDQVILVLLTTGMFVGGLLGFILDNTIPGTQEERGLLAWKQSHEGGMESSQLVSKVYDLPFSIGTKYCYVSWFRYLPACPKRLSCDQRMDELKAAGQKKSVKASLERNSEISADTRI
ncbi:solute carrier family 23 member 1-like isoform X5 [Prinia subflava]|uniref:solute carrier family 23 member 1-like isoform X5 n=1 Tax=Prinia subflava TaxID=208062 RepID=UPI002FDF7989